jgi:hypothetical protein
MVVEEEGRPDTRPCGDNADCLFEVQRAYWRQCRGLKELSEEVQTVCHKGQHLLRRTKACMSCWKPQGTETRRLQRMQKAHNYTLAYNVNGQGSFCFAVLRRKALYAPGHAYTRIQGGFYCLRNPETKKPHTLPSQMVVIV